MPALYLLLALAIVLLYLAYLACTLPLAAIAAFVGYGIGMPVAYFAGLGQVLVTRPPSLPAPKRRVKIPADGDPAVLQYFYGPALTDADHAMRVAYGNCRQLWQRGAKAVLASFRGEGAPLTAPFGVGGAIGMAAGTVVGTVATVGCALVHLLTVGISAALARMTGTVLRYADSAVLRVKNIRMVCPACYERVPYPAYECPGRGCARRHRDIRPGRYGIVRRRCQCGTRMKTLLLFGSSRMNAYCPHCGPSLEHRPGNAPEIVLPFFGAAGAGKTRLLFSVVAQLRLWSGSELGEGEQQPAERPGVKRFSAEFADSATTRKLNSAAAFLGPQTATVKTPLEMPQAYIIRLITKQGPRILHMFDAAGEFFRTQERTQELRYLSKAETFILVIDPLSVEAFWDRLLPDTQAELKQTRSDAPSPDLVYQQVHQEIEAMGVQLRKARLAVVLSRADLIHMPCDDVVAWAQDELGLGNLVRSARLTFKEARFFHTAAVMADGTMHKSVPELTRWVLARSGIDLPGEMP